MKRIGTIFFSIFIIIFIGVGCNKVPNKSDVDIYNEDINIERGENDLVIWSHYQINDDIINGFKEKYPGINVKVRLFQFSEYQKYYLAALSSEKVPNIMIMDSTDFGSFNTLDAFEDLSKEPYEAVKYKENFDKEMWDLGLSFDRKSLIGLSFASAPVVTYYRYDIMEEYGFPSEAEELAKFMENPENWLKIGEAFKKDGRYLCQWAADAVSIVNYSMGYFDSELNFIKDNPTFRQAVDISRVARGVWYGSL